MNSPFALLLSFIVFLPALGALILVFFPKGKDDATRSFTLAITAVVMIPVLWMALGGRGGGDDRQFQIGVAEMQNVFSLEWIPSFDIQYFMGLDGISFPLVILTAVISFFAMIASWSITKNVKAYCMLFLLLETGMLGVFMALDFFLFYVFWEVMLLPMYFLIGVWGGPRKEYAAIKFFLYTLMGSVLMLIAILMLYFNSDLTTLSEQQLTAAHVIGQATSTHVTADTLGPLTYDALMQGIESGSHSKHTFNLLALAKMGQETELFSRPMLWGGSLQHWAFLLLFIGFVIKVPSVPVHTWLPDAHVEAPTPISMILAGVLLKMGGYGILRICYPICPHAGYDFAWFVCALGVVSMVYGALAALAQKDFKRMVAYSSVSHMGYVVLGLGVWSATAGTLYNSYYWSMGVKGAMFQMIGHGVSSAGMFFMVGVIYDRVHHRDLDRFGGLYGKMPLYTALAMGIFFAGLGLPGLCGFIGEVAVVLSVWNFSPLLAIISAFVVILTAGYILWAIQRVYLGAEYKGPHAEDLVPIKLRELCVAVPLLALAIWFGVYPNVVFRYMDATVDQQTRELADWTKEVKQPQLSARAAQEEAEQKAKSISQPKAARSPGVDDTIGATSQSDSARKSTNHRRTLEKS